MEIDHKEVKTLNEKYHKKSLSAIEALKTKDFNGYQTKIINGEVVFTAKNGLGVNLGGTEYQKRITTTKTGYTKKISSTSSSNKMSGIEIINPNEKTEMYYQKMTGASGAIGEGNYRIIDSKLVNDKNLSGSISCRQMKIITNNKNININNMPDILDNNNQAQSYKKQFIITSKTESVQQKELNGSPSANVILKKRTQDSKNSRSNNSKIKDIPNSGNNSKIRGSNNSGSNNNSYNINQQISSGKLVFNSRLKTDGSDYSQKSIGAGPGQNKTITTTRQYEMRIKTNGDNTEKIVESKKTEVKFKNNKKIKNVQLLRDDNF